MTTPGCKEGWVKVFSPLASVAEVEERWRLHGDLSTTQVGHKHTKLGGGSTWLVQRIHGFMVVSRVGGCTAMGTWQELELEQEGSHEGQINKFTFYLGNIGGCPSLSTAV